MWPFGKRSKSRESRRPVDLNRYAFDYANGEALFDAQCRYGDTDIEAGKGIVAIVLDARKEFGTAVAVKVGDDGRQLATLRVSAEDGGFIVPAKTLSARGEPLLPGDVVLWVPFKHLQEVALAAGDERSGWVGHIVAKVSLRQPVAQGPLQLSCRYDS